MSNFLKPLSDIKSPDLIQFDRDSLVAEIVERIQADPNWNSIWDGELLHNFSYFIINTFSYLFSKNAEASNRIIREAFITQAKDPLSIINYLSNFSLNLKQNTSAMAEVTIRPNTGGSFTSEFYINPGFSLTATTINGSTVNYELYNLEVDENNELTGKIDYRSPIKISAQNSVKVNAFSGTTINNTLILNALTQTEKFIYNINNPNIIENSIRVFYEYNTINEVELIETDSFVVTPVISGVFTSILGGIPHYKIKYNTDGSGQIIFGSREFGGSFPSNGGSITVFYRIGGGTLSNTPRGGINNVISIAVDNFSSIDVLFYNFLAGGGGSDRENLDEAQFYAPYRIGRGRSIVDDNDALNELRSLCIKHKVVSPKYNGINVPILHYHNYISPIRDFSNFKFPIPSSTDTYVTYRDIFELELNKFLNLDGIHDGAENDILISLFRSTNFSFSLPFKPPLNGSLYISAYNDDGIEIDRLIWGSNYTGQINLPDGANTSASITSDSELGSIGISLGQQFFYFKIDDIEGNYSLPQGGTCFRVSLNVNQYSVNPITGKADALASEINSKIRSADTYYSSFPTSTPFAFINDEKKLVITSLSTGSSSSVQLYNFAEDSILGSLELNSERVDASPQNRKVFLETSIYNFENHQVNVNINTDWFKEKDFQNIVNEWENPNSLTGPIVTLSLVDENNNPIFVQPGTNLVINSINNTEIIDTLTFGSVSTTGVNFGVSENGDVFDDSNTNTCYYNYATGEIVIKLADSNLTGPDYSFPVDDDEITEFYNSSTVFNLQYNEKTYNFITVSMTPNPYFADSEANNYLLKLKSKDKKMIGIEPLLKKIDFKPFLLQVDVTQTKGFSREQAIQDTLFFIYNNFTYDNMVPEISIGTGLDIKILETYLNNTLILPSVQSAKIINPNDNIEDTTGKQYYFILNEFFMNTIKTLESEYPQIVGLYDLYKTRVKIV